MITVLRTAVASRACALRCVVPTLLATLLDPTTVTAQSYSTGGGPYAQPYSQGATRPFDGSLRSGVYAARRSPSYDKPIDDRRPADLAYRPPAIWHGLYLGAQAGYRWSSTAIDGWNAPALRQGGLQLGGRLGYNMQLGFLVFGVESDLMLGSASTGSTQPSASLVMRDSCGGTVRGRAGVAFGQALVYGTGGAAVADRNLSISSPSLSATMNEMRFGSVFGGGLEYKFTPNISTRIEALHFNYRGSGLNWNGASQGIKEDSNVLRGGLTLHFN